MPQPDPALNNFPPSEDFSNKIAIEVDYVSESQNI